MPLRRASIRCAAVATALAAATAPAVAARAASPRPVTIAAAVPAAADAPGYELRVLADPVRIVTTRGARTVLAMAGGADGGFRFRSGGDWHYGTTITSTSRRGKELRFTAATTLAGRTIEGRIGLSQDRYTVSWSVLGGPVEQINMAYDLNSAGHWYGHGEIAGQPYPLETGRIHQAVHSPASYDMVEPFWYTSSATGLWVDTGKVMDVDINSGGDGLAFFAIPGGGPYNATVFVEATPRQVNRDWIGTVGKPAKSDATYEQIAKPLWNSWAQFYTKVDQASLLAYAQGLHDQRLGGNTIQLDDKWESNYGNLTFDPKTFPDPRVMSDRIHDLGFDFGIWVTLWINLDSVNYRYAADHGYLLADGVDPAKPCTVHWWNGDAGVIDLAKPQARAWYEGNLRALMRKYRVDGFKFDTAFFNDKCAAAPGHQPRDYQDLGADLADKFDLQGAGIRVHWAGPQRRGFVLRTVDQTTDWAGLGASFRQALTLSTLGYPFVETDMIGGSCQAPPPTKDVLVRWAQAAALTPLMYSSTSPLGARDFKTGAWTAYDQQTIDLYRAAIAAHERLAPYIWDQVTGAVRTGDPIVRPLFFDFAGDGRLDSISDEWMLGPAVLAAPMLGAGDHRDIVLPAATWLDVNHGTVIKGPTTLTGYPAPLGVTPVFVRLGARGADKAIAALRRTHVPAASAVNANRPGAITAAVFDQFTVAP
jgi:alpha-glucosidase (family GH31 glycosyl hydrolase)